MDGFHRDHLNLRREEAGTLHVSHVAEPHYTLASASRSLSQVFITLGFGEKSI